MLRVFSWVFVALCLSGTDSAHANGADPSTPQSPSAQTIATTHNVGTDGAFTYSVPIRLPEFRGLVPALSLNYNSQYQTRRGADAFVAAGWRLGGFSEVERVSVGGGVPRYWLKEDVFRLDGTDLLACADSSATNAWRLNYPDNFKTTMASASCSTGGNMVTLRDNYMKIVKSGGETSASRFHVYRQDGTRYTYQSVGELGGASPSTGGDHFRAAYRRHWVLTEIRDKQSSPNIVTISYHIADQWSGFAPRPKAIEYVGYKVEFHYKTNPQPTSGFATGTTYIGKQNYRLNAVTVKNGNTKIRGYGLNYAQSPQTQASLLTEVSEYGSDYTLSSSMITGGSTLPSWTFNYESDAAAFSSLEYNNTTVHASGAVVDSDGNGREEIVTFPYQRVVNGATQFTLPATHYKFSEANTNTPEATLTSYAPQLSATNADSISLVGMTRRDLSQNKTYAIRQSIIGNTVKLLSQDILDSGKSNLSTVTTSKGVCDFAENGPTLLGNFDNDPESEVIFNSKIYNIDDGLFVEDTARRGELSFICSNTSKGVAVADIDGDGVDEIIANQYVYRVKLGAFDRLALTNSPFASEEDKWTVVFGDVNGDGAQDAVIHDRAGNDQVLVSLSEGDGFKAPASWMAASLLPDFKDTFFQGARSVVRDLNGDGLGDLILHNGFTRTSQDSSTQPLDPEAAEIYISDGARFVRKVGSGFSRISSYLGVIDVDGDGLYEPYRIVQNNLGKGTLRVLKHASRPTNALTQVVDQLGGTTIVEFTPSTRYADNDIPGVRQLVSKVTRQSGFSGQNKVTDYQYVGSKYDYYFRKSLGYRTVTAFLPKGTGETVKPQLTTIYAQEHWGVKGQVKSQTLTYNGVTQRQTLNTWTDVGNSVYSSYGSYLGSWADTQSGPLELPLRSKKSTTTVKERWGGQLLERRVSYTLNLYNQPTSILNYGFGGSDHTKDNVTTAFSYAINTNDYIVDKPKWMIIGRGSNAQYSSLSNWLRAEYYSYDGSASYESTPSRGNLTRIEQWSGADNHNRRVARQIHYDDYGNILWEKDARDAQTTHVYETSKNLFRTQTSNALGHVATTTWNPQCQIPVSHQDANNLSYSYTHDAFCRETTQSYPNGQNIWTSYHSIGSPTAQYVKRRAYSASTESGKTRSEERQYFNGYGQPYKSTQSGDRDLIADATTTLRAFDGRGNLSWESIPITWAQSTSGYVGANLRTSYLYDTLGRLQRQTNADGTYSTVEYDLDSFTHLSGQNTSWPTQVVRDAHCYDASSAGTICGLMRVSVDAMGRVIRNTKFDTAGTDHNGGSSSARITKYKYDNIGRIVDVYDPAGASWSYSYNSYGDRTGLDDPALGQWSFEHDANGNLTRQVDAKSQVIEFTYDDLNRVTLKRVGVGSDRVDTHNVYDQARTGYFNLGQLTQSYIWTAQKGQYHEILRDYGNDGQLRKETNDIEGRSYDQLFNYRKNGDLNAVGLPHIPGSTATKWLPQFQYDAANRLTSFGSHISSASYDIWSNPTQVTYGNGTQEEMLYNAQRGWMNKTTLRAPNGSQIDYTQYYRSATGRVREQRGQQLEGWQTFAYDYAGQLQSATNTQGKPEFSQSFVYDKAGSIQDNSQLGQYLYGTHKHAPHRITLNTPVTEENLLYAADDRAYYHNQDYTGGAAGTLDLSVYPVVNVPQGSTDYHATNASELIYGPDSGARFFAGGGDDILVEGAATGTSKLNGETGLDQFVISPTGTRSLVYGFTPQTGEKLDLSLFDDGLTYADLTFSNDNAWLYVTIPGASKDVLIRMDSNTAAEAAIEVAKFSSADFIFASSSASYLKNKPKPWPYDTDRPIVTVPAGATDYHATNAAELVYGPDSGARFFAGGGDDILVEGAVTGTSKLNGETGNDVFVVSSSGVRTLVYGLTPQAGEKLDLSLFGDTLGYADLGITHDNAWLYVTIPGMSKDVLIRMDSNTAAEAAVEAAKFSSADFFFASSTGSYVNNKPKPWPYNVDRDVVQVGEGTSNFRSTNAAEFVYGPADGASVKTADGDDVLIEGAVSGNSTLNGEAGNDVYVISPTGIRTLVYGLTPGGTEKLDLSRFGATLSYDDLAITHDNAWLYVTIPGVSKDVLIRMNSNTAAEAAVEFAKFSEADFVFRQTKQSLGSTTYNQFDLVYDANGNMTTGLYGKQITYDGENRPVEVQHRGRTTRYVYGAGGGRLKLIEDAGSAQESTTVTFGLVEIRNYGAGGDEVIVTQPHSNVRFVNGVASYIHRDRQQSIRMVTTAAGTSASQRVYKPFGESQEWIGDLVTASENKGWIGERFDDSTGLQFLNARYYDPEAGLFLQPDWYDVRLLGVGTNRYAYSQNDPINSMDPGGNASLYSDPDGDGLNDHVTHVDVGSDLHEAAVCGCPDGARTLNQWSREWGGLRQEFGQITGSNTAHWIGGGFSGTLPNGQSIVVTRNSPVEAFLDGVSIGTGPNLEAILRGAVPRLLGGAIGGILYATPAGLGSTQTEEYFKNGSIVYSQRPSKTPNQGTPGSRHVNPGSGQIRDYGKDGLPIKDIDYDHDHGQGVPHAHDWHYDDNGTPVRGPGRPVEEGEE